MHYTDLGIDIGNVVTSYTDHMGNPRLRQLLAGDELCEDSILITAGAAAALFITATSLLRPGDHVIILHPNYVTNIETPRAIGCRPDYVRLSFEEKFQINVKTLEQLLQPDTRLVSITYPHNPTGATIDEPVLEEIISLVESAGCFLLVDETYREMTFHSPPPLAASLSSHAISVSSMSKSYGLPGIRIGWLISQDTTLIERFLAAKEQIFICNSVIDENIAEKFLAEKQKFFPAIKEHIRTNFNTIKSWMEPNAHLEWVEPTGGCVCFPRIKSSIDVDVDTVYTILNHTYKTFVGPGHWFEMEDRYMRIGYGWPSNQELKGGLDCITKTLEDLCKM
jgi:aspartate/methionine/tyrosine aminotransferase